MTTGRRVAADLAGDVPRERTTPCAATETATTHIRHELFLGPVPTVVLADKHTGLRVARVSYELNVIDGWVQLREWTDESGLTWAGESSVRSRVDAVLDAAPECAEFIARSHLGWVTALEGARRSRQARSQRWALIDALRYHGLTLRTTHPSHA
jgi:hypothetical protein